MWITFITAKRGNRIGHKTTLMSLLTITGYECHGLSACVDANNYNQEIGEKFALEKLKMLFGMVLVLFFNGLKTVLNVLNN